MDRVIFASYGNDSIALIQWAHEAGLKAIVAYSDTGWAADWWPERVDKAEAWARGLGFQTHRIASEGMENLVRRKKAWPRGGGGTFQFCTHELKQKPALGWLDEFDYEKDAVCMVGIRREESANRATFPEWTESSERHGGRSLHAPLVTYTAAMRDALIAKTPFQPLPHRSRECYPCVNANKRELKLLDPDSMERISRLEMEMGKNSRGNDRVMFSPARHGGAIGIYEVVRDALGSTEDMFAENCDGGWCGG